METQYYTLIEKQDFFEIIENKFGELAIFIDARDGSPVNPVLEFDGKKTALLKRDERLAVRLDNIDEETKGPLAEAEFVLIVELNGKMVHHVFAEHDRLSAAWRFSAGRPGQSGGYPGDAGAHVGADASARLDQKRI